MTNNNLIFNFVLLAAVGTLTQCGDMPAGGLGAFTGGDNNNNYGNPYGGNNYNNNYNNNQGQISVNSTSNGYFVSFSGEKKNAVYNKAGRLEKQANCNSSDLRRAQQAVDAKIRSQKPKHNSNNNSQQPTVRRQRDGMLEVKFRDGGTVVYNKSGRLSTKSKSVTPAQMNQANQAVKSFMRN